MFDLAIQQRLWAMKDLLDQAEYLPGVTQAVLGMNNLLVLFDPLRLAFDALREQLNDIWPQVQPKEVVGREFVIPVIYGGACGEDLHEACLHTGLAVEEWIALHTGAHYTVACLGSLPGFAYLSGLPPRIAMPRRKVPRVTVPRGTVMIGGAQAGLQPVTSPSGWNMLGTTDISLFDPLASDPCLLQPGDTVRFEMRDLLP